MTTSVIGLLDLSNLPIHSIFDYFTDQPTDGIGDNIKSIPTPGDALLIESDAANSEADNIAI